MVVRGIAEDLETDAGSGSLSTESAELYKLTRSLARAFGGNVRRNEMSWRQLEAAFKEPPSDGEEHAEFDNGRTIN